MTPSKTPTPNLALLRDEVQGLSPYRIEEAAGLVKLDAMENPYAWPGALQRAWLDRLRDVMVNRYPDPQAKALKSRLRSAMGIQPDSGLLLGNGSDELIQILALAFNRSGAVMLAPEPSFVMYQMIATFVGMRYVGVALDAEFELDMERWRAALADLRPSVIFLAYPNNPTGNLFKRDQVVEILTQSAGVVVVDEAYSAFADDSLLSLLNSYPNLLIMRTLSKLGLAGLRLGYLVGHRAWIDELEKLRLPYNVNVLSQVSGEFALEHVELLDCEARDIRRARDELAARMGALPGVRVFPSAANFLLFRTPPGRAWAIFEAVRANGVLIKDLSHASPALRDCLRVTVGTAQENARFLDALNRALS